jgi:regulator of sigma E protease
MIEKKLVPQANDSGRGLIGVALVQSSIVHYPWYQAIWEGTKSTFILLWNIIVAFGDLLKQLFTGHVVKDAVGGPVQIAQMTGEVARVGFNYLLQFVALLSLNLAVINFFPFPALDGGRFIFLIIEKIKGKPVKRELEAVLHNVGFILLLALIAWVTVKDVIKLIN